MWNGQKLGRLFRCLDAVLRVVRALINFHSSLVPSYQPLFAAEVVALCHKRSTICMQRKMAVGGSEEVFSFDMSKFHALIEPNLNILGHFSHYCFRLGDSAPRTVACSDT